VRTIALVAFRRTTGGVVPSDRLVSLSDVVLTDGVGAGLIVAGPPADHGESSVFGLPPADHAPPR
jgi:hypothetical protein